MTTIYMYSQTLVTYIIGFVIYKKAREGGFYQCTQYSITFAACDPSPVFAHPSTRTPARGVMKYTILVKLPWSSLVCTRFFLFMHRSREDFTEMTFTQNYLPLGWGTLNLQFLVYTTWQIW